MRRVVVLPLAFVLMFASLLGTAPALIGAQESTPTPPPVIDCDTQQEIRDLEMERVRITLLAGSPQAPEPGNDLTLYDIDFAPGAEIPIACYEDAVVLWIESGSLELTVTDMTNGTVLITPAQGKTVPTESGECEADCQPILQQPYALGEGDSVFHVRATYGYLDTTEQGRLRSRSGITTGAGVGGTSMANSNGPLSLSPRSEPQYALAGALQLGGAHAYAASSRRPIGWCGDSGC
jgi:hypothetical protein